VNFRAAAGKALQRFGVAFLLESEDAVIEFVRSYLITRVQPYSKGQLAYAIKNNFDLWGQVPGRYKAFGHQIANDPKVKEVYTKYSHMVNSDLVLQWLRVDRPDMYSVITNWPGPQGRAWLDEHTRRALTELVQTQS